jgi:hypothetical protein
MAVTIQDVMAEVRNHFQDTTTPYIDGDFVIATGVLTPNTGLASGDYIAITGSRLNDGVYLPTVADDVFTLTGTSDESFTGRIWVLHPPKRFVDLATEIAAYAVLHPVQDVVSESFGPYSHSKATRNGMPVTWREVYAQELNTYRRMFKVVPL